MHMHMIKDLIIQKLSRIYTQNYNYCLTNKLISFLSESKDHTLIITHDIMTRLREKNGIENITSLKDIGSQIGFNSTSKYINGKKMRVLEGRREVFNNFIDPGMN